MEPTGRKLRAVKSPHEIEGQSDVRLQTQRACAEQSTVFVSLSLAGAHGFDRCQPSMSTGASCQLGGTEGHTAILGACVHEPDGGQGEKLVNRRDVEFGIRWAAC